MKAFRALALSCALLFAALPAFAQGVPDQAYRPDGVRVPTGAMVILGYDSVTSQPCVVGKTVTCVLLTTGGGGGGGTATLSPFLQTGAVQLAVSTSSARVSLPNSAQTLLIPNTGGSSITVRVGNSSVTAASTDMLIPPGVQCPVDTTGSTHVAILSASASFTVNMQQGTGGGGGCVVLADFSATSVTAPTDAGPTGSAVPARADYMGANSGGNLVGVIQADASLKVSISTNTITQVVALSSGKKIYVTAFNLHSAGTTTSKWVYGTGSNCGTGTTDLTDLYDFAANDGITQGAGLGPVLIVPASNALCISNSAAVHVGGSLAYTQF